MLEKHENNKLDTLIVGKGILAAKWNGQQNRKDVEIPSRTLLYKVHHCRKKLSKERYRKGHYAST